MKQRGRLQPKISVGIDRDLLASDLHQKLHEMGLSLRKAAEQMRCSPATLSRLLQGASSEHKPDTATLTAAAIWLNRSLADFDVAKQPTVSTLAQVTLHLRALPKFTATDVRVVLAVIEALQKLRRGRASRA